MQNVHMQEVKSHKHLGINLSRDCSWHQHISFINDKAWLRINIMRKLEFKLDRKTVDNLHRERSGSVVECLTRDRGAAGSSSPASLPCCP